MPRLCTECLPYTHISSKKLSWCAKHQLCTIYQKPWTWKPRAVCIYSNKCWTSDNNKHTVCIHTFNGCLFVIHIDGIKSIAIAIYYSILLIMRSILSPGRSTGREKDSVKTEQHCSMLMKSKMKSQSLDHTHQNRNEEIELTCTFWKMHLFISILNLRIIAKRNAKMFFQKYIRNYGDFICCQMRIAQLLCIYA